MKRIKYEDIQTSVQNYIKQRNLKSATINSNSTTTTATTIKTDNLLFKSKNLSPNNQQLLFKTQLTTDKIDAELNEMALNDLVLMESTINDFYAFTFDSSTDLDYLKQYKLLESFIQNEKSNELEQLLFPLFVYMCIDLVQIGYPIKNIISEWNIFLSKQEPNLIENLLLFDETKDLSKCNLVNNWKENKFQIKLTPKNWNKFLNFLRKSNVHLFLRIINLNLKIVINDIKEKEEDLDEQKIQMKQEKIEPNSLDMSVEKSEFKCSSDTNKINLAILNECINKINSQPSRINGMCCYHLEDHQDCITSVNISPDTEMIAVSNENSTIYLYKLSENTTINDKKYQKISNRKIQNENKPNFQELVGGHSSTVFKAKFTHDSKYLLSCGDDNTACLWNVNKTKENLENKEKEEEEEEEEREEEDDLFNTKLKSSWSKNYNPAQTSLVTSYSGHLYSVWDLELYSQLNLFTTASKDSTARLWSFDRIYPLRIFAGHQSDVNCVKFHPNGAYIATGSSDKTVRLWSVQSGDFVRLFSGHRSRVYSLAFSPDGTYLASAGEDKKIKVYDLRSGLVFKEFKGHSDIVHSLTFDNNSEILCSGGLDKTVKFWDLHQKNIKIGPELSDGCSGTSSGNSSNNTSSEFIQQNKNLSSPSTSNELIRSLNVDFNVYSIYCDMQNVFYVNGAKKMTNTSQSVNQNLNRNLNLDEKPIIVCDKKPMEKSIDSSSTKKISAKNKTLPGETKKTLVSNQSVEATSDTTPKTSINTRSSRRNASDSQTNTPTTSAQANASSFLFSNDDDLYEI